MIYFYFSIVEIYLKNIFTTHTHIQRSLMLNLLHYSSPYFFFIAFVFSQQHNTQFKKQHEKIWK